MHSARKFFLLFSIFLFIAFVFFSYLVAKEKFVQFDFDTTVKFQDNISRRFDLPFSSFSILGSVEVTGIIWLLLVAFAFIKRYWFTLFSLSLFWIGIAIEVFGKIFVHHPGPPFLFYRGVLKFNFPSSYAHTDYSYPSGHLTRTAFLVAFLVTFLFFKSPVKGFLFQAGLIVFLVIMFVSRVYLGEHWTTDVIGGTLLGSSLGIFSAITVPLKRKKIDSILSNL